MSVNYLLHRNILGQLLSYGDHSNFLPTTGQTELLTATEPIKPDCACNCSCIDERLESASDSFGVDENIEE